MSQAYFNGFTSACRNIFLTSSVALALFGYSNTFKLSSSVDLTKVGSMGILIFSILYGLNTVVGMNRYINEVEKSNEPLGKEIQLDLWKNFVILTSFYILLIFVILCLAMKRFLKRKL